MKDSAKIILEEELNILKQRIINNHLAAGQKASGRTIASLNVESDRTSAALFGRKAIGTLETGRKGGRVPKGFYYIIQKWVIDKGLTFDSVRERNTFAYFVSKKIAAEGTTLFKSGGRSDIYSSEIKETSENIRERIAKDYVESIINIKIN